MSESTNNTEILIEINSSENQSIPSRDIPKYVACNDPTNPPCRQFVNQGKCRRRLKCRFYHPPATTPTIRRKTTRDLGKCYCGAPQRKIMSKRPFVLMDDEKVPIFFCVCSRTGSSMKNCM